MKDFDWFKTTFRGGVREIGEVLLVLSPWNDPMPIQRAWCLFEIFITALEDENVCLHIKIPSNESSMLKSALAQDSKYLVQALSDIQAQKAQAKFERERDLIFDVIGDFKGGFSNMNQQLKTGLREWYVADLRTIVADAHDDDAFLVICEQVMRDFGFHDEALANAKECLNLVGYDRVMKSKFFFTLAEIYDAKGDLSLQCHEKSLTEQLLITGDINADVANSYHGIAMYLTRWVKLIKR